MRDLVGFSDWGFSVWLADSEFRGKSLGFRV